jgi:hypothetical protein
VYWLITNIFVVVRLFSHSGRGTGSLCPPPQIGNPCQAGTVVPQHPGDAAEHDEQPSYS